VELVKNFSGFRLQGHSFLPPPFEDIGIDVLFDVLAHLPDPRSTLAAVARVLRPGGFLVLSSVNESWPLVPVFQTLFQFCTVDLSAFYFDIRKDALYCDAPDSIRRRAARTVLDILYHRLVTWLAPILPFTTEDVTPAMSLTSFRVNPSPPYSSSTAITLRRASVSRSGRPSPRR